MARLGALKHDCQVAVVGAGPAGSAAAFFLANLGLDVLLIDRSEFPRDKTCGDALSPRALRVMEAMGALPEAGAFGQAIEGVRFIAPGGTSLKASIPPYPRHPPYAMILPRLILDDLLRRRALAAGARFLGSTHIVNLRPERAAVELEANAGASPIRARAAVLATGAATSLLQASRILRRRPSFVLAARSYFEGLGRRREQIDFHFDGVPLPGYGWVFPIGDGTANVGAGTLGSSTAFDRLGRNSRRLFDGFVGLPSMRAELASGRPVGPVKSYPLRMDFARSPTFAPRLLLAGEACGLVNPLTGEGIDYALESGQIAAEFLAEILEDGEPRPTAWREYDRRLRRRYQRRFVFTERMRRVYLRPWFLDRFLRLARLRPDLERMLVDIALGMRDAAQGTSAMTLFKIVVRG
ncbi:MAG: geranylgeranyl reductase family protein [Anaerolineales bacterium]